VFDNLSFQAVAGTQSKGRIQLLALSTCGFCKRGQEFLEKHQIAYEYIHLDTLDPAVKAAAKDEFKSRFGVTLSYPALVVDGTTQTVGYVKRFWEDLLGLPHEEDSAEVLSLD